MRLADLRPGWRTDFILHRIGAEVLEQADCIVVRTPANPTFYWGNFLLLPAAPADDDLALWRARFQAEIGACQPLSRHIAIGVDADFADPPLPAWAAAGFEIQVTHVLQLRPQELKPPAKAPRGTVAVRPLDLHDESEALIELECSDAAGFEPAGYRAYLRRQHERNRLLHAAGLLEWFGLWCDGQLAASCGLLREAPQAAVAGRFQRVLTHPGWRRRGLCSALVHAVSRHAFEDWRVDRLVMGADPDDVAIAIYRALGYRVMGSQWGLQRFAPQDEGARRLAAAA